MTQAKTGSQIEAFDGHMGSMAKLPVPSRYLQEHALWRMTVTAFRQQLMSYPSDNMSMEA